VFADGASMLVVPVLQTCGTARYGMFSSICIIIIIIIIIILFLYIYINKYL
jgi:hypothetical protein